VLKVEIPKPGSKGMRTLGIPTVIDRLLQQAVHQVISPHFEPDFSESSYGFRPHRSAQQAVLKAREYVSEGRRWVVDIDLEKFFDRVNHDRLMARVSTRVRDKRMLGLIRGFLKAGVLEGGLVSPSEEGTPQGGPLSPLLSNIVLDELDQELEERGHAFVRYADDCNIYVRSERAGKRVMQSLRVMITKRLRLRINEGKSAVARPYQRKFLGFSFTSQKQARRRIAPKAVERFKARIRELTQRRRGRAVTTIIAELNLYLSGWKGYFAFCETPSVLKELDGWIRRKLRCYLWKQWKTARKRREALIKLGVERDLARRIGGSSKGPWHLSGLLDDILTPHHFDSLRLTRLHAPA